MIWIYWLTLPFRFTERMLGTRLMDWRLKPKEIGSHAYALAVDTKLWLNDAVAWCHAQMISRASFLHGSRALAPGVSTSALVVPWAETQYLAASPHKTMEEALGRGMLPLEGQNLATLYAERFLGKHP